MRVLTLFLAIAMSLNTFASNFTEIKAEDAKSSLLRQITPKLEKIQDESLDFNGYWDETTFGLYKVTEKYGQPDDKTVRQLIWKKFAFMGTEDVDGSEMNPNEIDHRFIYGSFIHEHADEMTEEFMGELDEASSLILKLARKYKHIKLFAVGWYGSYYSGSFGQNGMAIYNTRSGEILVVTFGASE